MSDAVAKLRFDLLANVAGMTGPLNEGGAASEKMAERFNKSFDSTKAAAARATKELDAWKKTVAELRDAQPGGTKAMSRDQAWNWSALSNSETASSGRSREARLAEQLPFGKTLRTTISKEAAETAAAIGKATAGLKEQLAGSMSQLAGQGGAGGALSGVMGLASAHPVLAVGTAIAGVALQHSQERQDYVRETSHSARMFGESTENISRLKGAGIDDDLLSHFQRSIGEGENAGLGRLKLDPSKLEGESLKDALGEVAQKFNELPSAVDKARVAQELFGREGREMIPVLEHLKEKMENIPDFQLIHPKEAAATEVGDKEWKMSGGWTGPITKPLDRVSEDLGLQGGFGVQAKRVWTRLGDFTSGHIGDETSEKHQAEFEKDDWKIRTAESRARAKEARDKEEQIAQAEADRVQAILDLSKSAKDNVERAIGELKDPGRNARDDFEKELRKHGIARTPGAITDRMHDYDESQRDLAQAHKEVGNKAERDQLFKAQLARDPSANFEDKMDHLNELYQGKDRRSGTYQNTAHQYRDEYRAAIGASDPAEEYAKSFAELMQARKDGVAPALIRKAAAAAADRLSAATDDAFSTAFERFDKHMKSIDEGERSGAYTPDQAKRRRQAETEGELAHAGISRPKEDFRKAFEEITELHGRAIGNGGISDKEFEKRKKELEERASGAMTEDTKTVSPVAAMAAGSKEAYSMMVNAQLNDPKMQAQQEANKTLKAIEKAIVDKKASPGNTLGF